MDLQNYIDTFPNASTPSNNMVCSICLDPPRNSVVTPCGHIFCFDCLISSCQNSPDATKAPCPTCRTDFSLVTPNTMFIPEKYRQFIDSNIRRVFLDNSTEHALQERVSRLEARVKSLETQKDQLMNRCESYMQAATTHSKREKEARTRCAVLQSELLQASQSIASLVESRTETRVRTVHAANVIPHASVLAQTGSLPMSGNNAPPLGKRSSSSSLPMIVAPDRLVLPFPKRRRVSRQYRFSVPTGVEEM